MIHFVLLLLSFSGATSIFPNWNQSNIGVIPRGFILCGSNNNQNDLLRMHHQLRHVWKSDLPIAIAHCDELYDDFKEFLSLFDSKLINLELCPINNDYVLTNVPYKQAERRFRGFFCKVAALIISPFNETMILDSDTIWFHNPELLFESKTYQINKSLYFRDRVFNFTLKDRGIYNEFTDLYSNYNNISVSDIYNNSKSYLESNGVSLFWGNFAYSNFIKISEFQDSSCLLVHRTYHPKLIKQLHEWLLTFHFGYGDKEIFWISSTLQRENFTWEPFFAGQYGDCYGLVLHFYPDDCYLHDLLIPTASPLYINAEFMIERELRKVGDFIQNIMTAPVLATNAIKNYDMILDSGSYDKSRDSTNCTCGRRYNCQKVPHRVNDFILLAQWKRLSFGLSKRGPEYDCINIIIEHIDGLNRIFRKFISVKDCHLIGCPYLPITFNYRKITPDDYKNSYCEPVSFNTTQDKSFELLANKARLFL